MPDQKIELDYFRNILKHLLIFFMPMAILMGSILAFYHLIETRNQKTMLENSADNQVKMAMESLAAEYTSPISDLYLLAASQHFQKIFQSGYAGKWVSLIADYFMLFTSSRGIYDQIRFIDRTGMEKIRVNYKNGRSYIIQEEKLQPKANRFYFKIAYELDQDEIYASPFDLNIEHGEIERPLNPVIRFATPVFDEQGNKQGIIVLNYKGQELLENIKELSFGIPGNIMLVNSEGFWFLGAQSEDEWGFMLEDRKDKTFGRSFPEAWKRITAADSGSFSNREGIFSFGTSYPIHSRQKPDELEGDVQKRNHYLFETKDKYWKVIHRVSPDILKAKSRNLKNKLLFMLLVISAPLFAGTWFLVHLKVKFEARRKEAETELKNSEERLHTITSSANDAIIMMDDEGIVSYWNPAAEKIFGFFSTEIVGKYLSELIIPEKSREMYIKGVLTFRETGGKPAIDKPVELQALKKSGEEFPIELSLSSIKFKNRRHGILLIRDITMRKQMENELFQRMHDAELRSEVSSTLVKGYPRDKTLQFCVEAIVKFLDVAFSRIWTFNNKDNTLELLASAGIYTHLDGAHERITIGQQKIGMIAQTRQPVLIDDVIGDLRIHDQEWARQEGIAGFAGYPLIAENEMVGVVAIFSRRSLKKSTLNTLDSLSSEIALFIQRKRAEEERQRMQLKMISSSKLASLGELSAGVAHEINQPLTYISALIQNLRRDIKHSSIDHLKLEDELKFAFKQVDRIVSIINHLRTFGRHDDISMNKIDLSEIMENSLLLLDKKIRLQNIKLTCSIEEKLPLVWGNSNQLEQVFINLFQNAIDACMEKKGKAEIRVDISTSDNREDMKIVFADNGRGMEKSILEKIFDPFFTTKDVGKGTGLGLSISYGIIKEHSGEITCESGVNKGTTFTIIIPREKRKT